MERKESVGKVNTAFREKEACVNPTMPVYMWAYEYMCAHRGI